MTNKRQELSGFSVQAFVCIVDECTNVDGESSSKRKNDSCWPILYDNDWLNPLDTDSVNDDIHF